MKKLMTFGETMVSFLPEGAFPLRYTRSFYSNVAGAESNVAIGIAKLGGKVTWFSRLGEDEFGHFILNTIRSEGVDCSHVILDEKYRTGFMFKDMSRNDTVVYYYRENSAASHINPADIRDSLFENIDIVFLTGITPVLSKECREAVFRTIEQCNKKGIWIAFDPNIRKKLWKNRDYTTVLRDIMMQSQIVLTGAEEAGTLLGISDSDTVFDYLFANGKAEFVAVKNGAEGAIVADRKIRFRIPPYPCRCVESIGAGDGFNAGFLMSLMMEKDVKTAGEIGAICGAMATETPGDTEGYPDVKQLLSALNGSEMVTR